MRMSCEQPIGFFTDTYSPFFDPSMSFVYVHEFIYHYLHRQLRVDGSKDTAKGIITGDTMGKWSILS